MAILAATAPNTDHMVLVVAPVAAREQIMMEVLEAPTVEGAEVELIILHLADPVREVRAAMVSLSSNIIRLRERTRYGSSNHHHPTDH